MAHAFSRTEMLIGRAALQKLKGSKVAVFGLGGVGSFTVEALARTGVGSLILVDNDRVSLTNINRQIHANRRTVGRPKVDVMKERVLDINPEVNVVTYDLFYCAETADLLLRSDYDYVVDAIDTVSSKVDLIVRCKKMGIPVISSMGAGNKMDPTAFRVADIYETSVDPVARIMRRKLREHGIDGLKVVYSPESPVKVDSKCIGPGVRKPHTGSIAFVTSVAGLILAGEVIKDIIGWKGQ